MEMNENTKVSPEALQAFRTEHLAINDLFLQKLLSETNQADHLGDESVSILRAGAEFMTSSMEAVIAVNQPALLLHQLDWAKDRLPQDGIDLPQLKKNLMIYQQVIEELLPPTFAKEIANLIHMMVDELTKIK